MLDVPFMQPTSPSPHTASTAGKNEADSNAAGGSTPEFEAEYEEASVDKDGEAAVARNPQDTRQEKPAEDDIAIPSKPAIEGVEPTPDVPDLGPFEGTEKTIVQLDDKATKPDPIATAPDRGAISRSKPEETLTEELAPGLQGDVPNRPKDAISTPVPAPTARNTGDRGTTTENIVLAKSLDAPTIKNEENGSRARESLPVEQVPAKARTPSVATSAPQTAQPQLAKAGTKTAVAIEDGGDKRRGSEPAFPAPEVASARPVQTPASKSPPQTAAVSVAATIVQSRTAVAKDKADSILMPVGELEIAAPFEQRGGTIQAGPTQLSQAVSRTETPFLIARQMAEALQRMPERPVEIALSPKELGRVRMSISASEVGVMVSVIAERPETLDLMRRNIEQLSREFEMIGYSEIAFAFAEGEAQEGFSQKDSEKTDITDSYVAVDTWEAGEEINTPAAAPVTGVDIRL